MTPLDATAIVVTHNSAGEIGACLTSLRGANLAIRVVDNASTDATTAIVADHFPEVTLVRNQANVGFARAVNQGLARVHTAAVLLVNPDCVVPAATARGLVEFLAAHLDTGVAGPRLTGADGRVANSAHRFESLASVVASRFGGSLVPANLRRLLGGRRRRAVHHACHRGSRPLPVDWLSGACLAVRTGLLREIGGLDERYFLYYEDEELCLQAARRGAGVVYLPALSAHHAGGRSSGAHGATWPHLYRSMLLFFGRHRPASYQAVRVVVLVRAVLGLGLAGARLTRSPRAGAARARAWSRIAYIAMTSTRKSIGGTSK